MKKFLSKLILTCLLVGFCSCGYAESAELTILSTNDIHGHITPSEGIGGAAYRAGLLNFVRSQTPNVLVLDAGDYAQGTLYYKLFKEDINSNILAMSGYDAVALGNHEFDKGVQSLKKTVKTQGLNFLSSNLVFNDSILSKNVKPYLIKEYNGLRVGIIGVITGDLENVSIVNPYGTMVYDPVIKVRQIVREIDDKTDLIVVLSHCGYEQDIKIAKGVENIDVIVGGHSHTMLEQPMIVKKNNKEFVMITQNGQFGTTIGRLDVSVENDRIQDYSFLQLPVTTKIQPDKTVDAYIKKYSRGIDKIRHEQVGVLKSSVNCEMHALKTSNTNCGELVNNSIKRQYSDVEIFLTNGAQIRSNKTYPKGMITKGDIFDMLPFDNYVILVALKGKDLLSILETSVRKYPQENNGFLQTMGVQYEVDESAKSQVVSEYSNRIIFEGERIKNVLVNGETLEVDRDYKVATSNFIASGKDGYAQFRNSKIIKITQDKISQLLIDYLRNTP